MDPYGLPQQDAHFPKTLQKTKTSLLTVELLNRRFVNKNSNYSSSFSAACGNSMFVYRALGDRGPPTLTRLQLNLSS